VKSFKYLLGEQAYVGIECGGFRCRWPSVRFALQKFRRNLAHSTHPTLRWLNEILAYMQSL